MTLLCNNDVIIKQPCSTQLEEEIQAEQMRIGRAKKAVQQFHELMEEKVMGQQPLPSHLLPSPPLPPPLSLPYILLQSQLELKLRDLKEQKRQLLTHNQKL